MRVPLLGLVLCGLLVNAPARADVTTWFMERQVRADVLKGHLSKVSVPFPALGKNRDCWIYTPPGYGPQSKPLPVLVLLHGTPGVSVDWLYKGDGHKILDSAIAAGTFPPSLVVVPDGSGPFWKGGSEWADSVDGRSKMETAMVRDLPAFLKSQYHAATNPELWSVAGVSAGGFGATNLVVRHPEVYRNAVVLSGDFLVDDEWPDAEPVFGDSAQRQKYSPLLNVHSIPAEIRPKVHFYIAVGEDDDSEIIQQAQQFAARCKKLGIPVRLDNDAGGHKWGFWSSHLKTALEPLAGWLKAAG